MESVPKKTARAQLTVLSHATIQGRSLAQIGLVEPA
jgi:hypothetical protein